jgi:hypothetical protein
MNQHEQDGGLLSRILKRGKKIVVGPGKLRAVKREALKASEKTIKVEHKYISFRAATRRAMRKEIEAQCKKLGVTWRQARKYMREELKLKPTLNNMHCELVTSQGGEPC